MDKRKIIMVATIIVVFLILIVLVFLFTNKKCTVYFDSKGGTEVEEQVIRKGETAKEPEEPTREKYIFLGWYISEESEEKFDFSTKITEDMILIAKWEEEIVKEVINLEEISIQSDKNEITIGEELILSLNIMPENINKEEIEAVWVSSDETIATVSPNGVVKGIKEGTVTITVKIEELTASLEITIKETEEVATTTTNTNKNNTTSNKNETNTQKPVEEQVQEPETPAVEPETPATEPEEPAVEPKPEITYDYYWEKVEESVAGQYRLYIVSSEGNKVSGTATITTKAGKTSTVSIPTNGVLYVKDAISSVSNIEAN